MILGLGLREFLRPRVRQCRRSPPLDNIEALLQSGGARLEDMTHFIGYLRDASDFPLVEERFAERFPAIPRLLVRGAVCRPEWLVEVEGIAAVPRDAPTVPAF